MAKTWFVGAGQPELPPTRTDESLVPLSAMARTLIPGGGDSSLDLERLEVQTGPRVFQDLANFAQSLRGQIAGGRWLRCGVRDLSPAFRRPDEAVVGFANQAAAFEIASASTRTGPFEAWGADPFQIAGLRAALGSVAAGTSGDGRGRERLPLPPGLFRRPPQTSAARCDLLYLSLEPHVALQQDRVLDLLSAKYRIAAVALQRSSWPWPAGTLFKPPEHPALISYVRPVDIMKVAGGWMSRRAFGPDRREHLRWMLDDDCARWLRSTWLRAAAASDALVRAIEVHRPRLLVGTNLASGMGTVISNCAAQCGVAVLSLPTGADYLLPPQFDPTDVGGTTFVVPGERIAALLRQAGVPAERLLACGWPELDGICGVQAHDIESFRQEFGFDKRRPLAVFFSSPSSANDELVVPSQAKQRAFELLTEACRIEGFQLAVKLHPREDAAVIERLVAELAPRTLIFRDRLPFLVQAADVVASVGSAVSFAGAVLGKTTVILESGSIGKTAALFASVGVGYQPRSLEELSALLRGATRRPTDGDGAGFLGADGKVAERIRAAVDRLLE